MVHGEHPTVNVPVVITSKVQHSENCCTVNKPRSYTYIQNSRLEFNRPSGTCCGVPASSCAVDPDQLVFLNCIIDKFVNTPLGCEMADSVTVMYWDDPFFADSKCCVQQIVPAKTSCSKKICNMCTCGVCCNTYNVEVSLRPSCCPCACCECFRIPLLSNIQDPTTVAMQLNSAIATFKGGNSEKIGQVQVIPAGAPDESEMTR